MSVEPSNTPAPLQKPRRRWLQFSLRTLLLLMVPVACVAAWLGAEYQKGRRQKEAIAWVEEMGGSIEYDTEASAQDWRRQWLGGWYPDRVVLIELAATQISDFAQLVWLENLEELYLNDASVIDHAALARLKNLRKLQLRYTQVSDLAPLAGLENLEELYLQGTPVSDVSPLTGLQNLRFLNLNYTRVSDLSPLAELKNLEELFLERTPVSDLSPLAELENLRYLDLARTQVSDLAPLAGLENLELLWLSWTQVSLQQVQALEETLPYCVIDFYAP